MDQVPLSVYREQVDEVWGVVHKRDEVGGESVRSRLRSQSKAPLPPLTLKRKSISCESSPVLPKRSKTMEPEAFAKLLNDNNAELGKMMDSKLEKRLDPIIKNLDDLKEAYAYVSEKCEANSEEIAILHKRFDSLKETLKQEIRGELQSEINASQDAANRINLTKEIEKHSSNLIIHGLSPPTLERVSEVIEGLGIEREQKIEVKKVFPLGKGGQAKTILVQLGDPNQRNLVLGNASFEKLPKGVNIDRDVPPPYRTKYKEFKDKARDYRNFLGVICRVAFVGPELVLRYKEKGENKQFVIVETFVPPPNKLHRNKGDPNIAVGGHSPSKIISPSKIEAAKASFIMYDRKGQTYEDTESELKKSLGENFGDIVGIKLSAEKPLVQCNSQKARDEIVNILKKNGGKIICFG